MATAFAGKALKNKFSLGFNYRHWLPLYASLSNNEVRLTTLF